MTSWVDVVGQAAVSGQPELQVVLAQRVPDERRRPRVLRPVDLDDESPALPLDVGEVGAVGSSASPLTGGRRKAAPAALAYDVQLTERACAGEEVEHDAVQERPPLVAPHPQLLHTQLLRPGETLMHGHRQQQRRLLVRVCPQCRAHGRGGGWCAGQAVRHSVVGGESSRLSDQHTACTHRGGTARHRDADHRRLEVLETGGEQRGLAVEDRPGPPSKTAPHHRPCEESGPVCTASERLCTRCQRPARTCART